MDKQKISLRKTILVCLTTAVLVTFFAVAVKALIPVFAGADNRTPPVTTVPGDDKGKEEISLDPNLSNEIELASGTAIFSSDGADGFYTVYNDGERGFALKCSNNATSFSTVELSGKATLACAYGDNVFVAVNADGKTQVQCVGFGDRTGYTSRSYDDQKPVFATAYDDGAAFFFTSEGESGKRLIMRFYGENGEKVERYAASGYDVVPTDLYRIGDSFKLFLSYSSEFSSGGGYADFSLSAITAKITLIERNHGYTLYSAVPRQGSYALLCGSADGNFIMQLGLNLERNKKIDLDARAADGGRLCFDGKTYYALLYSSEGGRLFTLSDESADEKVFTYKDATGVFGEINTGARLVHLLSGDNGFFLTSTEGLFTKTVREADAVPVGLVKISGTRAAVCNRIRDGKSKVYACVFN